MTISELKEVVHDMDRDRMENTIIELYKILSYDERKDYDIDDFIINNGSYIKKRDIEFNKLKNDINDFIKEVEDGVYLVRNHILSKEEQKYWKFLVIKYYKELNKIPVKSSNGSESNLLLIRLFKLLSKASNICLFNTLNVFNSIGIKQDEFYECIMKRLLSSGDLLDNYTICFNLLDIDKDPNQDEFAMYKIFIDNIGNVSDKLMILDMIVNKVIKLNVEMSGYKHKDDLKNRINNLIICGVNLYCQLGKGKDGIIFLNDFYYDDNLENKEYILLNILKQYDYIDLWLDEYKSKESYINYRASLRDDYIKFINNK